MSGLEVTKGKGAARAGAETAAVRAGGQAGVAAASKRYLSRHLGPGGPPAPRPTSTRSPVPL